MKTLVTIIVPVYNVEAYILDCLNSIFAQDYTTIEVIAINDGSTDSSLKLLDEYALHESRLRIITQENKGLSGARNTGLDYASGEIIVFVDSDDTIAPTLVSRCINCFKTSNIDIVSFNHGVFLDNTAQLKPFIKQVEEGVLQAHNYFKKAQQLETNTWIPSWLYAYKASFLKTNNLRFCEGIIHEDVLFTPMALTFANTIHVLPDILYYYRKREGSITYDNIKTEKSLKDHLFIIHSLCGFSKKQIELKKQLLLFNFIAQRYVFVIEHSQTISSKLYKQTLASLVKKKQVLKLIPTTFYRKHIETETGYMFRILNGYIFKWPRRIYKYQIKSLFSK